MIMATLPEGGNVFEADEALSLPTPFYLPAKQKVVLTISKESEYSEAYPERDNDRADKAATFIARHLKELGGFVLFDKTRRYKILFPGKWPELGP